MSLILSGTNGVSDVDGTASNPAIRGTDTNTGMFFPAADTIAFTTNGTEDMRIDSVGNVGIGTPNPGTRVDAYASGTTSVIVRARNDGTVVYLDANNGYSYLNTFSNHPMLFGTNNTERMRIDTSGNVGIGTSSPGSYRLNVAGSSLISGNVTLGDYANIGATNNNAGISLTGGSTTNNGGQINLRGGSFSGNTSGIEFIQGGTERARIDSSGNLLVGKTTTATTTQGIQIAPNGEIFISRIPTDQTLRFYNASTGAQVGSITVGTSNTSYNTSSDYRLKEDIQPMTGALAKVAALKPVTYKWKADGSDGEGFIAHELQEVCPAAVTGEKDAVDADGNPRYQGIDTSFLVATLTAAIQELTARVAALENK